MDFIIFGCGGRYLCKQVKHVYIQMQSQTITSRHVHVNVVFIHI